MLGRRPCLPIDIMYETPSERSPLPDFVHNLQNTLIKAFDTACSNISLNQDCQQETYNQRVHGSPHQPEALVWLFSPVVPRGQAKKFHKPWGGPYKVRYTHWTVR